MCPIRDDKDLNILKQTGSRPEAIALIPINLVEGFTDRHAAPLQLNMNKRQSIDQNGDIVAGTVRSSSLFILIDDLQPVIVNISLVDKVDVFRRAVIATQ